MADAPAPTEQGEDGPPYPTFTDLRIAGERVPWFSPEFKRLIWPLRGSFPSAISVMQGTHLDPPGPIEPLFNPATGEWHPIASLPITTRKVSGLEASLTDLNSWDPKWERFHEDHADPAWDGCEYVTYGDLENDVRPFAREPEREDGTFSWDERSDTEILVRCCGQERPLDRVGLALDVRPAPGSEFVTIKDYVGAVHTWFMSMHDDILEAMRLAQPGYPDGTEWRIDTFSHEAPRHRIALPEEWNGSMQAAPITPTENDAILRMLHPERFAGLPPGAVLRVPAIHEPS